MMVLFDLLGWLYSVSEPPRRCDVCGRVCSDLVEHELGFWFCGECGGDV